MVLKGDRYNPGIKTMFIDGKGNNYEEQCFTRDKGTITGGSCSIVWNGKVYIYRSFVSRLDGTHLKKVKYLDFVHFGSGSCSVMGNKFVFVCFYDEDDKCLQADNPEGEYEQIKNSNYTHSKSAISTSESRYSSVD